MYGIDTRAARQRGESLLEELGLADRRDRQARTLSGGMQRRPNLTLARIHDPEIVVPVRSGGGWWERAVARRRGRRRGHHERADEPLVKLERLIRPRPGGPWPRSGMS